MSEVEAMEDLVRDKVRRHKAVRDLLLSTDKLTIKNGYTAEKGDKKGDPVFGLVNGVGHNHLGLILERIRKDLGDGREFEKWVAARYVARPEAEVPPPLPPEKAPRAVVVR
jgi:hypothetical protein